MKKPESIKTEDMLLTFGEKKKAPPISVKEKTARSKAAWFAALGITGDK